MSLINQLKPFQYFESITLLNDCVVPGNIDTLEIPSGSKAISKAKHFKRKYKAKLEFLEVWGWGTQTNLYRGHGVFVEQHIDCTCTLFTDSCFYLSCGK